MAIVLAFFFGPLGLLYASVKGAVIMFIISLVLAVLTLGVGLFIIIPMSNIICAVIAAVSVNAHNASVIAGANQK